MLPIKRRPINRNIFGDENEVSTLESPNKTPLNRKPINRDFLSDAPIIEQQETEQSKQPSLATQELNRYFGDPLTGDGQIRQNELGLSNKDKDRVYDIAKKRIKPEDVLGLLEPSQPKGNILSTIIPDAKAEPKFDSFLGDISPIKDTKAQPSTLTPAESTQGFQKESLNRQLLKDIYGLSDEEINKGSSKKAESILLGIEQQGKINQKEYDEIVKSLDTNTKNLEKLHIKINTLKDNIKTPQDLETFNQSIEEYNQLLNQINPSFKRLIELDKSGGELADRSKLAQDYLSRSQREESNVGDLPKEFWKTLKYMPQQAIGGSLEMLNEILAQMNLNKGILYDPEQTAIKKAGTWLREQGKLKERELKPKTGFWGELGSGAATMAIAAPLTAGVSVATGNPVAGFVAGFIPSFVLEGGLAYNEAKEYGLSDKEASLYSLPVGLISGAIEQLSELKILKKLGLTKKIAQEVTEKLAQKKLLPKIGEAMITGAKWEGIEELSQEITQLISESLYKRSEDLPGLNEILERISTSALYGSILGGFMGGGTALLTHPQSKKIAKDLGIRLKAAEERTLQDDTDRIEQINKLFDRKQPIQERTSQPQMGERIIPDAEQQTADLPSLEELQGIKNEPVRTDIAELPKERSTAKDSQEVGEEKTTDFEKVTQRIKEAGITEQQDIEDIIAEAELVQQDEPGKTIDAIIDESLSYYKGLQQPKVDNNANAIKNLAERGRKPEEISKALNVPIEEVAKLVQEKPKTEIAEQKPLEPQPIENVEQSPTKLSNIDYATVEKSLKDIPDLQKKPTGWKLFETKKGEKSFALVDPNTKEYKTFNSYPEAQSYAIDNPITLKEIPSGEIITQKLVQPEPIIDKSIQTDTKVTEQPSNSKEPYDDFINELTNELERSGKQRRKAILEGKQSKATVNIERLANKYNLPKKMVDNLAGIGELSSVDSDPKIIKDVINKSFKQELKKYTDLAEKYKPLEPEMVTDVTPEVANVTKTEKVIKDAQSQLDKLLARRKEIYNLMEQTRDNLQFQKLAKEDSDLIGKINQIEKKYKIGGRGKFGEKTIKDIVNLAVREYQEQPAFISFQFLNPQARGMGIKKLEKAGYNVKKLDDNYIKIEKRIGEEVTKETDVISDKEKIEEKESRVKFYEVAPDEVNVNTEAMQNREAKFSKETYNSIIEDVKSGDFDIANIPPVMVYKDETGKLWTLNHSRLKAYQDLKAEGNEDFQTIPVQEIKAKNLEEAGKLAKEKSNIGAKETPIERAKIYRKDREGGLPENRIIQKAEQLEGRNKNHVINLSYLNPDGKTITSYSNVGENVSGGRVMRDVADYIGEVRKENKELTDLHEDELFEWLYTNGAMDNFKNKIKFKENIESFVKHASFNPNELLGVGKNKVVRGSHTIEVDKKLEGARKRRKDLEKERTDFEAGKTSLPFGLTPKEYLSEISQKIANIDKDILDLTEDRRTAVQSDRLQDDLFSQITEEVENEQAEEIIATRPTEELEELAENTESIEKSKKRISTEEIQQAVDKVEVVIKPKKSAPLIKPPKGTNAVIVTFNNGKVSKLPAKDLDVIGNDYSTVKELSFGNVEFNKSGGLKWDTFKEVKKIVPSEQTLRQSIENEGDSEYLSSVKKDKGAGVNLPENKPQTPEGKKVLPKTVNDLPSLGTDSIGRNIPNWKGSRVYHSTNEQGLKDISQKGYRFLEGDLEDEQMGYYGKAISFTPDLEYTRQFGKYITVAKLSDDIKILNLNNETDWNKYLQLTKNISSDKYGDAIREAGYDGLYDAGAGDLFIVNPKKIKYEGIDKDYEDSQSQLFYEMSREDYGKIKGEKPKFYARFSAHLPDDLKRNWSSWNFGAEGFKGTQEELENYLNSATDELPAFVSGFDIYPGTKNQFDIRELYPNYWVVVDKGFLGGLAGHELEAEDIQSALEEVKKNRHGGTGEGDFFNAEQFIPVYSEEPYGKFGLHILRTEDAEITKEHKALVKQAIENGKIKSHPDYPELSSQPNRTPDKGVQTLNQDILERNDLQKLQDRKRHLELVIEEAGKKNNTKAVTDAKNELKEVNRKLSNRRSKESQFDIFGDAQNQETLFQTNHNKTRTAFNKLSPKEQTKFLNQLEKMLADNWGVEFKNLSKEQAAGITQLLKRMIQLDPDTANLTTVWEEAFHASMIALAKPFAARNMLREAGWNGKGEIWDVVNNQSLRDAHEKLAKDFIKWAESSKEPSTRTEKVFALLKDLWNKIAAFLYQSGFHTHAGYFEMLYSGKLKASAEGINVEDLAQSLAQEINREENFKRWFGKSKVVDKKKNPLIVYHSSTENFDEFQIGDVGFHFGTKEQAEKRASPIYKRGRKPLTRIDENNKVLITSERAGFYPAYLSIQNPIDIIDNGFEDPNAYVESLAESNEMMYDKKLFTRKELDDLSAKLDNVGNKKGFSIIQKFLKDKGFDGIVYFNNFEGDGRSYAAFNPTQIKSIFNRGTFDPNDANILGQSFSPIWFSKLERVIEQKAPNKNINPTSLIAMLKNNGVKDEEIKWLDVKGFLEANPKATKKELIDYVKSNQVEIKEVTKGVSKNIEDQFKENNLKIEINNDETEYQRDGENYYDLIDTKNGHTLFTGDREQVREYVQNDPRFKLGEPTKFEDYKTAGGSNYREVLFTLPDNDTYMQRHNDWINYARSMESKYGGGYYSQMTPEEKIRYKELEDNVGTPKKVFSSSHWDEPNVVAHVRLQDFTDTKGRKVLLVEEVQSDWHQAGKKKGYQGDTLGENYTQGVDAKGRENYKFPNAKWSISKTPSGSYVVLDDEGLAVHRADTFDKAKNEIQKWEFDTKSTPSAPFKSTWHELTLKRVLRLASEEGYDGIALTTGEQQADRYDLSKQVDEIRYDKLKNGDYQVNIFKDGKSIDSKKGDLKSLEDYVGKDIVKKIADNSNPTLNRNDNVEYSGSLKGVDLKVGGEGMKGFYDKMLPSFLNSYAKKWGARVDEITINAEGLDFDSWLEQKYPNEIGQQISAQDRTQLVKEWEKQVGDKSQKVQYLPITDAMRSSVLFEGQALFQKLPQEQVNVEQRGKEIYDSGKTRYAEWVKEMRKEFGENQDYRSIYLLSKVKDSSKFKTDITADIYEMNRKNRQGKLSESIGRESKSAVEFMRNKLVPISTRLGNIAPSLKSRLREFEFDYGKEVTVQLKRVQPFLQKSSKLEKEIQADLDLALKNGDVKKINEIIKNNDLESEYKEVRTLLDGLYKKAIDVGIDLGYRENYHPRSVKDLEAFIDYFEKSGEWNRFQELIDQKTIQKGDILTLEEKVNLINNALRGYNDGISLSKTANMKERKVPIIDSEINKFYYDSNTSLVRYISAVNEIIEARKFFGKKKQAKVSSELTDIRDKTKSLRKAKINALQNPNGVTLSIYYQAKNELEDARKQSKDYQERLKQRREKTLYEKRILEGHTELTKKKLIPLEEFSIDNSIGNYVLDLIKENQLNAQQAQEVESLLKARFNQHGTSGLVSSMKNISYVIALGSPTSAITQIGDLAIPLYRTGPLRTLQALGESVFNRGAIKLEDLGINPEKIAQEFSDPRRRSRMVQKVFTLTGFNKIDILGKETLVNATLKKYQRKANNPNKEFLRRLEKVFEGETDQVIKDLQNKEITENVKLLLFNELLDTQPIALSEMPEGYLTAGDGRIFYMLKTFFIRRIDYYRNETFKLMKDKETRPEGIKNLIYLTISIMLMEAGADELEDLLLGRETSLKDRVIDNLARLVGFSKYSVDQVTTKGLFSTVAGMIVPPFDLFDDMQKDIFNYINGKDVPIRSVKNIPVLGKIAYNWWMGAYMDNKSLLRKHGLDKSEQIKAIKEKQKEVDKLREDVLKGKIDNRVYQDAKDDLEYMKRDSEDYDRYKYLQNERKRENERILEGR